jgi:uncharacterized protein with ParB-like and HNH nuclease domain
LVNSAFILLALLRDQARSSENPELADKIEKTMLVNPYEKGSDYFKLLPTQVDRTAFKNLVYKPEGTEEKNQVTDCYRFFARELRKGNTLLTDLVRVITGRLSTVSIVLAADDNPHLVFESLNAKGRALTQADLIRNYFFMRFHVDEQTAIHTQHWQPMQESLGENLTEFIRHYLMMRQGSFVKQGEIYFTLKDRVTQSNEALATLKEIATFAAYCVRLLKPEQESHPPIREALRRLNRLEVSTAYPFLLNCYHDYAQGKLTADDFTNVLATVENFIVRRFVCGVPTNQLNKIFPALYSQTQQIDLPNFIEQVRDALQARGYPKDVEFKTRLKDSKLYGSGQRAIKTKLILETLELAHQHKEQVPVDSLPIEHIMPQTLTDWWKEHLGEDWQADHELYLHTLGNLTLTAYNSELSNAPFPDKRRRLADSHLELNRYFEQVAGWSRTEIEQRAEDLAGLALSVWPYFGADKSEPAQGDTLTGKKPRLLKILGQEISVQTWRDVLVFTLNTIADLEPDGFHILVEEYPYYVRKEMASRCTPLNNGFYVYSQLSAKDVDRLCQRIIETVGLSPEDWKVEVE